jgi:hypothetical protein
MTQEKMILNTSDEAAQIKTLTGWVSRTGQFWGDDERMARWSGATHLVCSCGEVHEKGWTCCQKCRDKKDGERFLAKPFKEWDGETPLTIWGDDTFFFDEDSIVCYLEDNDLEAEDLQLVICEPNCATEIDYDRWSDDLPEDRELDDIAPELAKKVDELNAFIREHRPILSWGMGKYRTVYKPTEPTK